MSNKSFFTFFKQNKLIFLGQMHNISLEFKRVYFMPHFLNSTKKNLFKFIFSCKTHHPSSKLLSVCLKKSLV